MPSNGTIFAFDSETSAINYMGNNSGSKMTVADGCQMVSFGIIAVDRDTFSTIDALYVEIKWNGTSKWDAGAQAIHGLSKEHLEEHGEAEEQALCALIEFLVKHGDISKPLEFLGHNFSTFDVYFIKDVMNRFGIDDIKFGARCIDTYSLGKVLFNAKDSNETFAMVGLPPRTNHNALTDAACALNTVKRVRKLWNKMLNN